MDQALIGPAALTAQPPARPLPTFAVVLAIAAVALLTRLLAFGNPVVILDDQFYLVVGDAVRHGLWPYIDIWDRKPVGLFLLYAGIAAIGDGSIVAMHIVATLFAAATALVIHRIASLFVAQRAALLAALAYLVMLPQLGGVSGQTPVFYNLLVAGAAWLLLGAAADPARPLVRNALIAMLLCGLAMSIKPAAVFEGAGFGFSYLWLLWRRGTALASIASTAFAMVAVALLPVVLPFLAYALRGDEARDAFVYANFISIFQKDSFGLVPKLAGIAYFAIYASPLLLTAAIGVRDCWADRRRSPAAVLLVAWLAAAFVGYAAIPLFFDHYALPLLAPLSVAAAFAFNRKSGPLFAAAMVAAALFQGAIVDVAGNRAARAQFALVSKRIDQARHGGCLYVADGPTYFYNSTGACRLTRYLFPHHVNLNVERNAVGIDQPTELQRILRQRPAVIVTQDREGASHNPATRRLLQKELAANYRTVHRVPADAPLLLATLRVWQRRDLVPPKAQ
jgi:4-amino-4-deoxy-L-arabinose transferase-like glycosyltransferase